MRGNQTTVGLGIAAISAATFGTAGSFADSLMRSGWTPGGAVTTRIGFAALLLTVPALIVLRGRWGQLRRSARSVVAYGLVAVAGCQLFFFNAVQHLSVGVALLLEYCGTLLVVLWMWARHGQRPSRMTMGGGAVALVGLVLVLDLTGPQRVDVVGILWAIGAAAGLATYFVVSAHASDEVPPIGMAWAGMVLAVAALGVCAVVGVIPFRTSSADAELAGHAVSWVVPAVGVALVATVAAYTTGIAAARRLGARVASFVGLAEVVFAILFAWLLLSQRPSALQLVGAAVVVAGIALVRIGDRAAANDGDADDAARTPLEIPLAGASPAAS